MVSYLSEELSRQVLALEFAMLSKWQKIAIALYAVVVIIIVVIDKYDGKETVCQTISTS